MAAGDTPWRMTLPSDLRLLVVARAFVEAVCSAAQLERKFSDAVVLAAHEAVANVMRHAHQGNPEALLEIQCHLAPDALEIRVLDEGEPFDVNAVPDLDPAEIRLGGRGVFLMRTLMDELHSEPRGPKGNTLRMVKRCPRKSPGPGGP